MAYPVFSGDMAALNQGFAAQEAAANQRRAANQNFLAALAAQAQQARTAQGDQANRLQMAQLQDATARERIQQEGSLGRQANSTNLLKVINDQNNELAKIENERNRLRVLEAQGNAQAGLERQKLEEEGRFRAEQLKNLLEIAKVNASARLAPPSVQVETLKQAQEAEMEDRAAAATASMLMDKANTDTRPWYRGSNAGSPDRVAEVAKTMTPEERMMVIYDPKDSKAPFKPRVSPLRVLQQRQVQVGPAAGDYRFPAPQPASTNSVYRVGQLYPEIFSR